jgi:deazaflavin-dependent oxidoreductase (nitroreductase family)
MAYYLKPDWFNNHVFNPTVALMTRAGISIWGSRILQVRGRKSGELRSNPVNLLTYEGKQYLVSPRGLTQWVRNIRVSGGGELVLGNKVQPFRAVEIPDSEKAPLVRAYIKRFSFEVRRFFKGVKADSTEEDLRRIAPDHPVFRIDPA